MNHEEETPAPRGRPRWRLALLALLLLVAAILFGIWFERREIAADYIARELQRRGVQASYDVREIGFRTQRLENVVIGDPRRPDATAQWVEVQLSLGIPKTRVTLITARGVRLFGRVVNGRVSPAGGSAGRVRSWPNGRVPLAGRRQAGISASGSSAEPALDQGLSRAAQPFSRVRSRDSAPLPPSAAPASPECPVSSTARSSVAPAEATVCLQWR